MYSMISRRASQDLPPSCSLRRLRRSRSHQHAVAGRGAGTLQRARCRSIVHPSNTAETVTLGQSLQINDKSGMDRRLEFVEDNFQDLCPLDH
jgi:hypothetical protein